MGISLSGSVMSQPQGGITISLGLGAALPAPGAPSSLATSGPTAGSMALSWTAPSTGGLVMDYIAEYRVTGTSAWILGSNVGGSNTSVTVNGLAANTSYDFRVRAINTTGTSAASATATGSTSAVAVPGKVPGLTLSGATTSSMVLTWSMPTSGGVPSDYLIQYRITGAGSWTTWTHTASSALTATITGLNSLVSYDFQVSGVDAGGTGTASNISTASTLAVAPGQVTAVTAGTLTATSVPLSWTAPSSGNAPTDYLVQYRVTGSGTWLTFSHAAQTTTAITVTGLTPLTSYDFQIAGVNSAGTGTFSSTLTASTLTGVPGAPSGLTTGTMTYNSAAISWTAPTTGVAPSDYLIQYRVTGAGSWSTFTHSASSALSATVTGLTYSTSYDFQVSGVNSYGTGTASSTATASTAALPAPTVISAPTIAGSAQTGSVLTASHGSYTNSPSSYTGQWIWGDTSAAISGATAMTYTPVAGDAGHTLEYVETAINSSGSVSSTSAATAAVVSVPSWVSSGAKWQLESTTASNRVWLGGSSSYASIAAAITASAITFSRTAAKYIDVVAGTSLTTIASGAVAMSDNGLCIEPAGTNVCGDSATVGGGSWTNGSGTAVTNNIVAPDGTTTASKITGTGSDGYCVHAVGGGGSATKYCSFWMKVPSGTTTINCYTILHGSVTQTTFTLTTSWQKCLMAAATTTNNSNTMQMGGGATFTSGKVIHIWGGQCEDGQRTSYIPSSSGASGYGTRDADVFKIFPPSGTYSITFTFDDASTQTLTGQVITSSGYTIPTSLNRPFITGIVAN